MLALGNKSCTALRANWDNAMDCDVGANELVMISTCMWGPFCILVHPNKQGRYHL